MSSHKLHVIGIGDMIIFASELLEKDEELTITLERSNIENHKSEAGSYWEFSKKFISRLLPEKRIEFTNSQDLPRHPVDNSRFLKISREERYCEHFKRVFIIDSPPLDSPYVVLSTKARYYLRSSFDSEKQSLFDAINSWGMKVILLGEKEVEYNLEYKSWGNSQIYSIYGDAMKGIRDDLLVDMTVPKLGTTTPDIDKLFSDMSIAYQAKACINIGVGGFYCMSIFSGKLRAACKEYANGVNTFETIGELVKELNSLVGEKV